MGTASVCTRKVWEHSYTTGAYTKEYREIHCPLPPHRKFLTSIFFLKKEYVIHWPLYYIETFEVEVKRLSHGLRSSRYQTMMGSRPSAPRALCPVQSSVSYHVLKPRLQGRQDGLASVGTHFLVWHPAPTPEPIGAHSQVWHPAPTLEPHTGRRKHPARCPLTSTSAIWSCLHTSPHI